MFILKTQLPPVLYRLTPFLFHLSASVCKLLFGFHSLPFLPALCDHACHLVVAWSEERGPYKNHLEKTNKSTLYYDKLQILPSLMIIIQRAKGEMAGNLGQTSNMNFG